MIYGTVDGTNGANAEWHKFPIDVVARFEVAACGACVYYLDGVAFLAQHVVKLTASSKYTLQHGHSN
eukprot:8976877-Ditylum_brightwellii.AAC.1